MPRYMIEASHDPSLCQRVQAAFLQAGAHYLARADWGCKGGTHKAWITVETESDTDARLMVPPIIRTSALLVKLNKFTPEEVRAFHQDEQ